MVLRFGLPKNIDRSPDRFVDFSMEPHSVIPQFFSKSSDFQADCPMVTTHPSALPLEPLLNMLPTSPRMDSESAESARVTTATPVALAIHFDMMGPRVIRPPSMITAMPFSEMVRSSSAWSAKVLTIS